MKKHLSVLLIILFFQSTLLSYIENLAPPSEVTSEMLENAVRQNTHTANNAAPGMQTVSDCLKVLVNGSQLDFHPAARRRLRDLENTNKSEVVGIYIFMLNNHYSGASTGAMEFIERLGILGDEMAVEVLMDSFSSSYPVESRCRESAIALGKIGNLKGIEFLADYIAGDNPSNLRILAANGLAESNNPDIIGKVEALIERSSDIDNNIIELKNAIDNIVVKVCENLINSQQTKTAFEILNRNYHKLAVKARADTFELAGKTPHPLSIEFLKNFWLGAYPPQHIVLKAIAGLLKIGDALKDQKDFENAKTAYKVLIETGQNWLFTDDASQAIEGLCSIADKSDIEYLGKHIKYRNYPQELKRTIAKQLASIGGAESIEPLHHALVNSRLPAAGDALLAVGQRLLANKDYINAERAFVHAIISIAYFQDSYGENEKTALNGLLSAGVTLPGTLDLVNFLAKNMASDSYPGRKKLITDLLSKIPAKPSGITETRLAQNSI